MDVVDLVSDLEEGEILDDSPSSSNSEKKIRELPQRYIVRGKNTPPKHKKDCKHSIRYHTKKLTTKMKKSPKSKDSPKKYHKSTYHHERFQVLPDNSSKNLSMALSKKVRVNSLIEEIVKSLTEDDLSTKPKPTQQLNFGNILSTSKTFNNSNFFSPSAIGRENDFQPENRAVYSEKDIPPFINIGDLGNFDKDKTVSDININVSSNVTSFLTKNEESEDEEELRRIALATFSKRKDTSESSANLVQSINNNCFISVPEFLENNIQIQHQGISIPASDNYEIVDMEVDEDIPSLIEVVNADTKDHNLESMENLYVIDTKPYSNLDGDSQQNISSKVESRNNSSDEDFETDILRAELIGKLYEEKDNCVKQQKPKVDMHTKQASILSKRKCLGSYKKQNFSFYRKQLRTCRQTLRKTVINNKSENMICNVKKTIVSSQENKPTERLVIALNEESSSENSDSENPVASIEALISDCRQKSSALSTDKTEVATLVPKALLCLSKAQQEEYSSLRKILAEKEKIQVPSTKNESAQLTDDLKRLEENLLGCKETLEKKKELMMHLSEEVSSKKLLYMKSKLTAEHLKEQYIAAEKIRKVNFLSWSKSWNEFKSGKKTVLDLENKINQLQSLCSKLGATIYGQTK